MQLSVVTTLYCSAPHIEEFYRRATESAKKITENFEIIFVNDGSPDPSLEVAKKIFERDQRVKIIDLSRNFGHHKAVLCGLAHAQGEKVFFIDSDLEEAPECITDFHEQLVSDNCDVVYGIQTSRNGHWFDRWAGKLAYRVFNVLCNLKTVPNHTSAILMTRRYIHALGLFVEREPFFMGITVLTGFKQGARTVIKTSKGTTTYTLAKRVSMVANMITSFSSMPLHVIFYTGLLVVFCSVFYALYLFIYRVFFAKTLDGWTSIMISVWFLGGLMILFIGVVGIYLARVFVEVKQRPNTIIRDIYERK